MIYLIVDATAAHDKSIFRKIRVKEIRPRNIILGLAFTLSFIVIMGFCFIYGWIYFCGYLAIEYRIPSCLKFYIRDNNGQFPDSRQDLIGKGYLRTSKEYYSSEPEDCFLLNASLGKTYDPNHIDLYPDIYFVHIYEMDQFRWDSNKTIYDNKPDDWFPIHLDDYHIRYGSRLEDIELKGDKLYDKNSQERILLVEGPHKIILRWLYTKVSRDLYEEMSRERADFDIGYEH